MDRDDRQGDTLSHEFAIHLMELMSGVGVVIAMYYLEHPAELRIGMVRLAQSLAKACTNQSVFWIRQANRISDMGDRFKL
jgi:hypothetical protein